MNTIECPFEEEVLAAALQSRWPDRISAELRAHTDACANCRELAAVVTAVGESRDELRPLASIPDSGRMWWTAQLRARREALEAAARPITAVQLIACACAAGLAGAFFGATSDWFRSVVQRLSFGFASLPSPTSMLAEHWALAAGMALLLFVLPAAVYFAMGRD